MILSISRRTDIPAFYMPWFLHRLHSCTVLVRNPMRHDQIRQVDLTPSSISGLVFWTKNPRPMLPHLPTLSPHPFYILYTLNPYSKDIEPHLPSESERIQTFRELSSALGPERVLWRYDPILLTSHYTESFHLDNFTRLCALLSGATLQCKTSFVSPYAKIRKTLATLGSISPTPNQKQSLASRMRAIALDHGITLTACCDPDLSAAGLPSAACIDASLLEKIGGCSIPSRRDSGQRPFCSCSASVDIGSYDTCPHGCVYCYAARTHETAVNNFSRHDPLSPFLLE